MALSQTACISRPKFLTSSQCWDEQTPFLSCQSWCKCDCPSWSSFVKMALATTIPPEPSDRTCAMPVGNFPWDGPKKYRGRSVGRNPVTLLLRRSRDTCTKPLQGAQSVPQETPMTSVRLPLQKVLQLTMAISKRDLLRTEGCTSGCPIKIILLHIVMWFVSVMRCLHQDASEREREIASSWWGKSGTSEQLRIGDQSCL